MTPTMKMVVMIKKSGDNDDHDDDGYKKVAKVNKDGTL